MKHALNTIVITLTFTSAAFARNTPNDPHTPLSHCYHWLNEGGNRYLSYKYSHATRNDGELTFYTTGGNGAVAGPGLYCGKSPVDSYSYGDRVIRIDFVDDVVLYDEQTGRQYCGHNGNFYASSAECNSKSWDVKFYSGGARGGYAWYVIRNPQSIARWSAVSNLLIADLNANKPFNNGFAIHADNTIKRMYADPMAAKIETFENQNARLSIIKILSDPAKLAQVPPLTVISQVRLYTGKDLNKSAKEKIYREQFDRAFKDTMLGHSDFLAAIKDSKDVEKIYLERLMAIDLDKLDKENPVVILQGLDHFAKPSDLTDDIVKKLWRAAILSGSDLYSLVEKPLKTAGVIANGFEDSLPTLSEITSKLDPRNINSFISILNAYVKDGNGANTVAVFNSMVKKILLRSAEDFVDSFDKISNASLRKLDVLADIISKTTDSDLRQIDPLTFGLAVERAETKLDSSLASNMKRKLLDLPLLVTNKPTYQILEDFQYGKLAVPSFYPEVLLTKRILERGIDERAVTQSPSNTFRMAISGLYYLHNERVKKAKGGANKSAASQAGAQILIDLASIMDSDELIPYRYAVLQNASYFLGNGRYDNHPIDAVWAQYAKGNAALDALIEDTLITSYDGTVLQFLATLDNDPNAPILLMKMAQHLLSDEFKQIATDLHFVASQAEKKSWDNVIKKGRYSKSDRVASDICHLGRMSERFKKELKNHLSDDEVNGLISIKDTFCK